MRSCGNVCLQSPQRWLHPPGRMCLSIACNTASTLALAEVRRALDIPVVGTVPAIKPAAAASQTKTIGLLATPGTISRAYTAELIRTYASDARVIQQGSIELVRLAEAQARGEEVPLEAFAAAQAPLFEAEGGEAIDTIVLACTHFPLVRAELEQSAPQPAQYVDSGAAIARQTIRVLPRRETSGAGGRGFVTSPIGQYPRLELVLSRFGFAALQGVDVPAMTAMSAPASP